MAGAPDPIPLPERFDHLETIERWWLRIGVAMLVVFVAIVLFDALRNESEHSGGMTAIAPSELASTAPFDKPGVYPNEDGSVDAVVVSYAFGFLPKDDLVVPHGVPVHFKIASLDVVHGYQIPGVSNVNLEVVPGHISEVTQVFDKPGRHLILCHEFCGSGHHFMVSHIRVLEPGQTLEDHARANAADGAVDADAKETAA
jgi:cytochrome c oxidase subunit II